MGHVMKLAAIGVVLSLSSQVWAGAREQAFRIHERIAGVPPDNTTLQAMEDMIDGTDPGKTAVDAAYLAMENDGFYNVTLKNWVTPWTNGDFTVFAPLNDFTATVIGLVRDNRDFRSVLYTDKLYEANSGLGLTPYSQTNNNHYEELENGGYSLKDNLVEVNQSARTGVPSGATAGVMTTRAAAKAFFIDGTNRAMFRYTLVNFMCKDLEQLKDTSRPPDRIRQDVTRSPGGDSQIFLTNCIGCHSGMDPLAQAFAYYQYEYTTDDEAGRLVYNTASDLGDTAVLQNTRVQPKYHINYTNFPYGFVTEDDSWDNYWRAGPNAALGWNDDVVYTASPGSGSGAKSMGEELAHSDQFARCQVEKVFKAVCLRVPGDANDEQQIDNMIGSFTTTANYNIKQVFAESAAYCKGD